MAPVASASPWPLLPVTKARWLAQRPPLHWAQGALPGGEGYAMWSDEGVVYLGYTHNQGLAAELAERQRAWPQASFAAAPTDSAVFSALQAGRYTGPLVLVGTAFQQAVWQLLLGVPAGGLTSYGRLAQQLNRPKAARAIGQAVGANPISLLIPCHRVVASDGTLGGYHWGIEMKQRLLVAELDAVAG